MCRRCGLFVCCSTFTRGCSDGLSNGILHGSWCRRPSVSNSSGRDSFFRGFSRPVPSYPSVPSFGGFTRSSLDIDFSGAGITGPRRDGDGRSSAVGAGLGCLSAGSRLDGSSLIGSGDSPPTVDRIDASWETLVILGSSGPSVRGNIPCNFRFDGDGCSGT